MAPATDEQAAVLALVKATPHDWYRTADIIACTGSALRLIHGDYGPFDDDQRRHAELVLSRLQPDDLTAAATLIDRTRAQGAHLVTVLDEDYPDNLHMIYNRPPFIWVRGRLGQDDIRSVAIVGTRQPTGQGRAEAARFAQDLAEAGITVVSGLARGIDTAAHTAALRAGGRTIAVVGNGILSRTYPAENAELAKEIAENGAVISQFWPDAPPARPHFPMRNIVTSGIAAATLVVEASVTSGAKAQARMALDHGKHLFLPHRLHQEQDWAKRYAARGGVTIVRKLDDILDVMVKLVDVPRQEPFIL